MRLFEFVSVKKEEHIISFDNHEHKLIHSHICMSMCVIVYCKRMWSKSSR